MKFKKIYVEITNVCNLNCSFCAKTERTPAFMTTKQFAEIIEKIKPHTNYVYLHVLGEPLLHPNIGEFLDICTQNDMKVNLTTNGTLIKQTQKNIVKPSLRQVNFSLHSAQFNDDQQNYLADILNFCDNCHKHLFVNLRFWNKGEDDDASKQLLEDIATHFNYRGNLLNEKFVGAGVKVHPQVFVSQNTKFTWPTLDAEPIFTSGKCYGLKDHIGILADGTVVPCCLDANGAMNLGNLHETLLSEILESKRVEKIKNGFGMKKVVEPLCQTCGFALRLNQKP